MENGKEAMKSAANVELKCNKRKQFHPGIKKWRLVLEQEVTYTTKNNKDLHLQIIYPVYNDGFTDSHNTSDVACKEEEHKFPLVVYVKGSAWQEQNRFENLPGLSLFADRGYVTALVEYRPSSTAAFPAQIQDAKLAIEYLHNHAEKYNIDTGNIFLWGDSSGAHTALMAALTGNMAEFTDIGCREFPVRGIIDYSGPTDFTAILTQESTIDHNSSTSPEGMLLGGVCVEEHPALAAKASAVTYISDVREIPPVLILHGNKDRTVPLGQSELLFDKLNKSGHKAYLYVVEGADHGGYEFWCEEALDLVEDFMDSCIR